MKFAIKVRFKLMRSKELAHTWDYHAYVEDPPTHISWRVQQEVYYRLDKLLQASPRWDGETLNYHTTSSLRVRAMGGRVLQIERGE